MTSLTSGPDLYRLICPPPDLRAAFTCSLTAHGWQAHANADIGLLIDCPWGIALQVLERTDPGALVVVIGNPCPEYREDILAFQPRGLLVGSYGLQDITRALKQALRGEFFQWAPHHDSVLTPLERRLLRQMSMGWDNRRIAQENNLAQGTVKNGLSRVFQKLGFDNRTQACLYYWGLWHLLDDFTNPEADLPLPVPHKPTRLPVPSTLE